MASFSAHGFGWAGLIVGAILIWAASRPAVSSLCAFSSPRTCRAFGNWVAIAAAALIAAARRHGDLALAIIFSTSIASLSLILGSVVLASPERDQADDDIRRVWPFVLPAALLVMLAGFAGQLTVRHALIFFGEGFAILMLWHSQRTREMHGEGRFVGRDDAAVGKPPWARPLNFALAAVLAIIGAATLDLGAIRLGEAIPTLASGGVVVAIVAPVLVLPLLVGGTLAEDHARTSVGTTTSVLIVLLNLCLLLPAVILLWHYLAAANWNYGAALRGRVGAIDSPTPLIFPLVTWRLDSVLLVVLSFLMIPLALGRHRLGRSEGGVLICVYAVYVLLEMFASMHV